MVLLFKTTVKIDYSERLAQVQQYSYYLFVTLLKHSSSFRTLSCPCGLWGQQLKLSHHTSRLKLG